MPFDDPSALGLTMSGNFCASHGCSFSRPVAITWNSGVRMPCCRKMRLDSALSSASASVAESEPV